MDSEFPIRFGYSNPISNESDIHLDRDCCFSWISNHVLGFKDKTFYVVELLIPEHLSEESVVMNTVSSHVFENPILSISISHDGESVLVASAQSLYVLSFSDCLHDIYNPKEYKNQFHDATSVSLLNNYFIYYEPFSLHIARIDDDDAIDCPFNDPIADVSYSSNNSVVVILENGDLFLQESLHAFEPIALPDSFSQYKCIQGQSVCWGGTDCFIACFRCDDQLLAVIANRSTHWQCISIDDICSGFGAASDSDFWVSSFIPSQSLFLLSNTHSSDLGVIEICKEGSFTVPDISEEPNHCVPENEDTFEAEQVVCFGIVPIPTMECSGLLLFGTKGGAEYAEKVDFNRPMNTCQDSESSSSVSEENEGSESEEGSDQEKDDDFPQVPKVELDPYDEEYLVILKNIESLSSSYSTTAEYIEWFGKSCQYLHQLKQQYSLHYSKLNPLFSLLATQIKEYANTIHYSKELTDIESVSSLSKLLGILRLLIMRAIIMESDSSESRLAAQATYRDNCKMIIERIQKEYSTVSLLSKAQAKSISILKSNRGWGDYADLRKLFDIRGVPAGGFVVSHSIQSGRNEDDYQVIVEEGEKEKIDDLVSEVATEVKQKKPHYAINKKVSMFEYLKKKEEEEERKRREEEERKKKEEEEERKKKEEEERKRREEEERKKKEEERKKKEEEERKKEEEARRKKEEEERRKKEEEVRKKEEKNNSTTKATQAVTSETTKSTTQPSGLFGQGTSEASTKSTTQPSGLFGQVASETSAKPTTQPSGGLFGQGTSEASTKPQTQPSGLFGQAASETSTKPKTQPSGLFGQPASETSTKPTTQPSGGLFGQPTSQNSTKPTSQPSGGLFGQSTPQNSNQPSGGLFGQGASQTSTKSTSQPSGGLFGQPASQNSNQPSGGLFGQPASQNSTKPTSQPSGGLFGQGAPASTGNALFGGAAPSNNTVSSGLFNRGTAASNGGLFSSPNTGKPPSGGGLFGQNSSGLFSGSSGNTGGLFGGNAGGFGSSQQTGGLFGGSPAGSTPMDHNKLVQILTQFYQQYCPDKVKNVESNLNKYKGNEMSMITTLEKKYCNGEPVIQRQL